MAKSPAQKFWEMVNETKEELFGSGKQEDKSEKKDENENEEKLTKEEILKEIEKLEERIRKLKQALGSE